MPEGLLTLAAFGAGMTVIGSYLVALYLVADALLDRLTSKSGRDLEQPRALSDAISRSW